MRVAMPYADTRAFWQVDSNNTIRSSRCDRPTSVGPRQSSLSIDRERTCPHGDDDRPGPNDVIRTCRVPKPRASQVSRKPLDGLGLERPDSRYRPESRPRNSS